MIFFTDNLLTVVASKIKDAERIDAIDLRVQAGQVSSNAYFRVAVDDDDPYVDPYGSVLPVTAYTTDPHISLSTDSVRGFGPLVEQVIQPGRIGSTIFVKASADLDATEGDRMAKINVNGVFLTVRYFVAEADKGDTENPPMDRFAGDNTYDVMAQFEAQGESLELVRYDPLPKPAPLSRGVTYTSQDFRNQNVVEWTNPRNAQVGYRQTIYFAKGFVGDQDLMQNLQYGQPLSLDHGDAEEILLPADFEGFSPTPHHTRVEFSRITPTQTAFQRTQWTVKRHDGEYALINIRRQMYYRGQLLFYAARLQRVNYPGADSSQGFLPWNQLYDEDGKVISYVAGFSRETVENPYCEYGSDSSNILPESSNLPVEGPVEPEPEPEPLTWTMSDLPLFADSGQLALTNPDYESTFGTLSFISLNRAAYGAVDATEFVEGLQTGDVLQIRPVDAGNPRWVDIQITGAPTGELWLNYPVTSVAYSSASHFFAAGTLLTVTLA